jgi:sporulation integral membrane protein YtvI
MDEINRYSHDRATVMALVKYILFVAIAVALAFLSSKLVVIILPFLLGFVIAKASRHLANILIRFGQFVRRPLAGKKSVVKEEGPDSSASAESVSQPETTEPVKIAKPGRKHPIRKVLTFFFPSLAKGKRPFKTRLTLVVYAVLVIIILGSLTWAMIALIGQLNTVIAKLPQLFGGGTLMERIEGVVRNFSEEKGGFLSEDMVASVVTYIKDLLVTLEDRIPSFASSILRGLLTFFGNIPIMMFFVVVVIMSGVYFITDGKKLLRFFAHNIRNRAFRHKSFLLLDQLSTTLFRVLGGYLALLIITFFESLVVFYLAGIEYAVLLALITAVLDFMPVLGVSATMVPMMAYMIFQGNYAGFFILLAGLALVTVVRRVIEPPILGNAMNMHPLATLFAMIIGVAVWGAIGFLVGPVVLLIVIEVLKVFSFDKKLRDFMGRVLKTIED